MSSLDSIYQDLIMDHARHPHGKGLTSPFDGESFQVNPTCGDRIQLRVRLAQADGGSAGGAGAVVLGPGETEGVGADGAAGKLAAPVLESVSWDGQGCSISQASASMMTDLTAGQSLSEVLALEEAFSRMMRSRGQGIEEEAADSLEDAIALEGVSRYPMRVKCALLGWMALKDAVAKALAGDATPAHIPEGI
ncbi:MAG: SUF system NifU family Fe-S cluster assembly protein [Bifidobacteriaceae bacterium]|jgi:nitrogen fixation NifU-like protein|nr:SUF system NifU family Fe-S cluster assembly protein [Bifidobacteriaceae bacterium]